MKALSQFSLGLFEVLLFMRKGIERFPNNSSLALKSFAIPLVLLGTYITALAISSLGYPAEVLFFVHMGRSLVTVLSFLFCLWLFLTALDRKNDLYKFITIHNFLFIPLAVLKMPILLSAVIFPETLDSYQHYSFFILLAFYTYVGFTAFGTFKLPWPLAVTISCAYLIIGESFFDVAVIVRDMMAA